MVYAWQNWLDNLCINRLFLLVNKQYKQKAYYLTAKVDIHAFFSQIVLILIIHKLETDVLSLITITMRITSTFFFAHAEKSKK